MVSASELCERKIEGESDYRKDLRGAKPEYCRGERYCKCFVGRCAIDR